MFQNTFYAFDEMKEVHTRLEELHEERRALHDRINSVDMRIEQILHPHHPSTIDSAPHESWDEDQPPFHLVGA